MKVSLFIACYNDTLFPETGKSVVRVLERLGHEVLFPSDQTCCGQMHWNTGYLREAVPIIRHHYPKAARGSGDPQFMAEVDALLPRIFEFSELLANKLGVEDVGATYPHRVT